MAITYRITKGSELTYAEMDENFSTLVGEDTTLDGKIDDVVLTKMGGDNFLHIQDQKAQGTDGGTFTSGAWQTRDLNTVLTNTITDASLATNQITLPAGKYYVEASAPAYYVLFSQAKFRRITATAADILIGTPEICVASNSASSVRTIFNGVFQAEAEVVFEFQQRCHTTKTNNGLGSGNNFTTEVYSDIRIWRIGEYVAP